MKDTPFMQLGLRVERSTYFQFKKIVKSAKTTNSKYLREMLNRELLNTKTIQNESGTN